MAHGHHARHQSDQRAEPTDRERMVDFLVARLTEDLAMIWVRDQAHPHAGRRAGMAAQVAILDETLTTLRAGALPIARELRVLLYGYGAHLDYDPSWTEQLSSF